MKILFGFLLLGIVQLSAIASETFTGVITDTMCGSKPHTMMKGHSDLECVRMCVKGPYNYALNDGTNVIRLSDQKAAAKYAAQKVKIAGTFDEKTKTIKVASIEAASE